MSLTTNARVVGELPPQPRKPSMNKASTYFVSVAKSATPPFEVAEAITQLIDFSNHDGFAAEQDDTYSTQVAQHIAKIKRGWFTIQLDSCTRVTALITVTPPQADQTSQTSQTNQTDRTRLDELRTNASACGIHHLLIQL